ncbi:MAG: HAD-IC family P-type ATPase, partial [Candidatus Pacebacteria bacterium]|nr:HAD-IC family P-type ATPase [Candidatus Paceibacterota bacterium]
EDKIITGKVSFFEELGIKISEDQMSIINQEANNGFNVTLVGKNNELIGLLILGDVLKPNIKEVFKEIKELGVEKIVMLTGDNEKIAANIAKEVGIDEFHANLLPEQKIEYLKKYMDSKHKVAMIGDGVNDAPCIALADIGIAMGVIGSDTAIDSADIALMKDDIRQIPELIKIGKKTLVTIKQDLIIWGIINIVGFALVFGHIINPAGAAVYNFTTDFVPILHSLQLFR